MKHIVNFSGGKDSAAMLLMMLEKDMPVDDIVFVHIMATKTIGAELPETYEYIEKVGKYIGRKITHLYPPKNFEEYFYRLKRKGNHIGDIYGFPYLCSAWCNSRLKVATLNHYFSQIKTDYTSYIGIAADETKRLERIRKIKFAVAPLADWGITEAMAKKYLENKGLLNPLYEKYDRLGCWFCGKASLKSLRILYHDYPQYWAMLRNWQKDSISKFKPHDTIFDLEERFQKEDRQLLL